MRVRCVNLSSPGRVFVWLTLILGTGILTACSNEQNNPPDEVNSTGIQACAKHSGYELINGQIITMDENDSVVSSLTVENGRIVAVEQYYHDHVANRAEK